MLEGLNEYNFNELNDYVPEFFDLSHSCGTIIENLPVRMEEKVDNKQNEEIEADIHIHEIK